ncbi:hypothetical protein TWF225_003883 [Orbilia oligospora]|nr:hypothetical protein TWF225_003883 [Orbilia oligospora]KAF3258657.1 hypothetical protein TWF217_005428 [Orbilia oligospora]
MKFNFSQLMGSTLALGVLARAAPLDGLNLVASSNSVKQLGKKEVGASSNPAKQLLKRTVGGIYITTDVNWQGQTGYKVQPLNTCISLTAPWLYTISSFGPDRGTACVLYSTTHCDSNSAKKAIIFYPGSANLGDQNFNDQTGSWKCYEVTEDGHTLDTEVALEYQIQNVQPTTHIRHATAPGIQAAATPGATDFPRFTEVGRQALINDGWMIVSGIGKSYYTDDNKLDKGAPGAVNIV